MSLLILRPQYPEVFTTRSSVYNPQHLPKSSDVDKRVQNILLHKELEELA